MTTDLRTKRPVGSRPASTSPHRPGPGARTPRPRPAPCRLTLEPFEDRCCPAGYDAIDLGTLGGVSSATEAYAVNNASLLERRSGREVTEFDFATGLARTMFVGADRLVVPDQGAVEVTVAETFTYDPFTGEVVSFDVRQPRDIDVDFIDLLRTLLAP